MLLGVGLVLKLYSEVATYIFVPRRHKLTHCKYLFRIRIYREEDLHAVLHVAKNAFKNYIGRYHADPHLPNDLCDHLYQQWAQQLLTGDIAERVIVAERRDKVVGFLGYRKKQDILSSTGIKVVGGGWWVVG